eukprot:11672.XXX_692807_693049_1 [CDS] Oithona nana genome sequencing.
MDQDYQQRGYGNLITDEHGYTYSRHKPYTNKHSSDTLEWRFRCSRHFRQCLCYIRVREGEIIGKYHEHNHLPIVPKQSSN